MTTKLVNELEGQDLETWNSYLVATRLLFEELDRRLEAEAGVSLPDFILLFRLRQAGEDGMRMSELADSAVFSRSRISHAMNRLEKAGWTERRSCPTDRRGSFASLTKRGKAKLEQAEGTHSEVVRQHLLGSIEGEDIQTFTKITQAVRDSLGGGSADKVC